MRRYLDGDLRAFDAVFARHAARLHAFFVRWVRSAALADDLVQTTFLRVHASRHTYDSKLRFRPWLYRIATNERHDALRGIKHPLESARPEELDGLIDRPEARPESAYASRQEATRVREAIDALPEPQRLVILLHRFEELSFAEIAIVLSDLEGVPLTEGAVRVRAFRALGVLRTALMDLLTREDRP